VDVELRGNVDENVFEDVADLFAESDFEPVAEMVSEII